MRKILVITSTSLVGILFLLGACGPSPPTTPTPGPSPTSAPEETSTTTTTAPPVTTPTPIPTPTPTPISSPAPSPPTTSRVTPTPPEGYKGYADSNYGFFIAYPEKWEKRSALFKAVSFVDSLPSGVRASVEVEVERGWEGVTAKEYLQLRVDPLVGFNMRYTPISTEEVTIEGEPAIKHIFTCLSQVSFGGSSTTAPGVILKTLWVIQVKDGKAICIACSTLPELFKEYEAIFGTMTSSFRYLS